ncbi:MAG: aminotransferase class I/II-fold pyridoxal phosphate-dependent enzyme, partial [Candidatus Dadabacteria bacterium]|nr:aminotransferase class I/II-fold pyridoxal phosphate-dependent enzyme [Candidatus Dadabacteria bacterium]NIV41065.1 aminotransferase class I/II-fold pyridoxal phosphate-dependent enzyme [Candidatus Dadabacteria bacterium]NIX14424.1 aminotransferase class I/II-fold pyridoxal phosphate-dependent enzyme [Candidatus Dadabacteria bacterium]
MISKLANSISPFYVMEVLERAQELQKQGTDIIHLEIGEPDHNTDDKICKEAIKSINAGDTKYTHSLGISDLREQICSYYKKKYGVSISAENIIVTNGSSPALFLAFCSVLNPGDEIILTDPHYACYPQIIKIAAGVPKFVKIYEKEEFQIDIKRLKKKISKKTRAILINSPSNPTGMLVNSDIMHQLSELGIPIISDEIYHGLVYEGREQSMLEYTKDAIVVSGFSKLYSMTGWRLGYLIVPDQYVRPIQKLQQNLFISANSFVQRAGIEALKMNDSQINKIVNKYKKRRDAMLTGLKSLGFEIKRVPDGA